MKRRFPLVKLVLCGLLGALAVSFSGCEEEKTELVPTYETGVLISTSNANISSLDYYNRGTGSVERDLFNTINNRTLRGEVVSMATAFDRLYLLTSSGQMEALQANTLTSVGNFQGLVSPQRLVALNNRRGFVTQWATVPTDSGHVLELNLATFAVTKTLKAGKTPTAMVVSGNRLFVANAGENKISVINTGTNALDTTLTVGHAPNSMVVDAAGFIWVLCAGKTGTEATKGQLVRITPNNLRRQTTVYEFPNATVKPGNLVLSITRNRLYFLYDGVYVMDIGATALPANPLIKRTLQTLGQDPTDGLLYTSRTEPGNTGSWVIRYQNTGAAVDSFQVEGVVTGFSFR